MIVGKTCGTCSSYAEFCCDYGVYLATLDADVECVELIDCGNEHDGGSDIEPE